MENLKEKFEEAAVNSKKLPSQSNDNLLKLYALYKQATEGDVSGSKPSMFDFKGVAKYDAWEAKKGLSKEDAMKEYIDLVGKLGA
ncbi:MAG: acyl-CoA-binding protein [Candidatus Sericytochromatia bacterium]